MIADKPSCSFGSSIGVTREALLFGTARSLSPTVYCRFPSDRNISSTLPHSAQTFYALSRGETRRDETRLSIIDSISEQHSRQARSSVVRPSSCAVRPSSCALHSVSRGRISIESFSSPSIVASLLYGASPIDPALKPGTSAHPSPNLSRFDFPSADRSGASPSAGANIERQFSPVLPQLRTFGKTSEASYPDYKDRFSGLVSVSTSLPGLAALASVASAPTSNLR